MPAEIWVFAGACGLVCALLVGFGYELIRRNAPGDGDEVESE